MLLLFELLTISLAILNATIPGQQIPIEVETRLLEAPGTAEPATAISSSPIVDAGIIGTIATLGGAMFAAYTKNKSRDNATADTSINLAHSLKATDKGTADIANNLATALQKLAAVNPDIGKALESCKTIAKDNAEGWNKDLKQYYETDPPVTSQDLGLDKVKQKLKEVNKMTTKTPEL